MSFDISSSEDSLDDDFFEEEPEELSLPENLSEPEELLSEEEELSEEETGSDEGRKSDRRYQNSKALKRQRLMTFMTKFEGREDPAVRLKSFWRNYPREIRPSRETCRRNIARRQEDPNYVPRNIGRPNSLSEDDEEKIAQRCFELIRRYGNQILTNSVIQGEALDIARIPRDGESPSAQTIFQRCQRVGGYKWCLGFRKRHGFTKHRVSRPIEIERAFKMQPEFSLVHLRNVLHVYALMHIHRTIASGTIVGGWVLPPESGWVVRDRGPHVGTNNPILEEPIVTVRKIDDEEVFWIIPLDCRLIYPEASEIINFDEKPLVPDSVNLNVSYGTAIAYGRSQSWTVVLYMTAEGLIVGWTLIMRGASVDAQVASRTLSFSGAITATPKGYQTDITLLNDLQRMIDSRAITPTRDRPYFILADGHGSRLTSNLLRAFARNSIYCVIEPSHTSTFTQALDQEAMHCLQRTYEKHLSIRVTMDPHTPLSILDRVVALTHAISQIRDDSTEKFRKSWKRIGLPNGIIHTPSDVSHRFRTGSQFRGENIPSHVYFKQIFSKQNIAKHPQQDIEISFLERIDNGPTFCPYHKCR